MTAFLGNGLFISELLADNAGNNKFDTDGDGSANKADEFVEIQSASNVPINLDGFEIWSAQRGLLYAFGPGDVIEAGGTATVVGQYDGTPPEGFYDAGLPDNNQNQGLLLDGENKKNDTIFLLDRNTGEYVSISYGEPPTILPTPPGFTGTTDLGAEQLTSNAPNGVPFTRDEDGDFVEGDTPTPGNPGVPCFGAGTLIVTDRGNVQVENLLCGDRVMTVDAGWQPIVWVGGRTLSVAELAARPELSPYRVAAGSLGEGAPSRDLVLSPQHRVLIRSRVSERMFGSSEVLIAIKHLSGCPGIERMTDLSVSYFHILLPAHHVIMAEGALCESLYLGTETLRSLPGAALEEIAAVFPGETFGAPPPARPFVPGRKARRLAERHTKNRIELIAA